jgi:hypothetical protein
MFFAVSILVILTWNRASQYLFKSLLYKSMRLFDSQRFKSVTEYCFGPHQIMCASSCLEPRAFKLLGTKLVRSELFYSEVLDIDAPILVGYPPSCMQE